MKRTKLVSVSRGEKNIQDRIKDALKQYSIKEESLIEVRIGEEEEGRTTALIIYDPDKRDIQKNNINDSEWPTGPMLNH